MPVILCCSHRESSPEPANYRYSRNGRSRAAGLFVTSLEPSSTSTVGSSKIGADREIRKIFDASEDHGNKLIRASTSFKSTSKLSVDRRNSGNAAKRLRDVLRKRLSRDSGWSLNSSRKTSRIHISEEDIERRRELMHATHQRLQKNFAVHTYDQEGYDRDAELIATPVVSRSPGSGTITMTPKELRNLVKHIESYQSTSDTESQTVTLKPTKQRGNNRQYSKKLERGAEQDCARQRDEKSGRLNNLPQKSQPLGSKLVLCNDLLSSGDIAPVPDPERPHLELFDPVEGSGAVPKPPTPNLVPLRMPSITDSLIQQNWRLSFSQVQQPPSHAPFSIIEPPLMQNVSSSATWRSKTVVVIKPNGTKRVSNARILEMKEEQMCNPVVEDQGFGGVDGTGYDERSPNSTVYPNNWNEYSGEAPEQILDIVIPPRTPSKRLNRNSSVPHLKGPMHSHYTSGGNDSEHHSAHKTHKHRYSHSIGPSTRASMVRASLEFASSVYTSQGGSLPPSPNQSFSGIKTNSSDLRYLAVTEFAQKALKIAHKSTEASQEVKTLDLEPDAKVVEFFATDTPRFRSCTEISMGRELAASVCIVPKPRASSVPKTSRFREELEEPKRQSFGKRGKFSRIRNKKSIVGKLDGAIDSSKSSKRQGYGYNFVPENGDSAGILWERALQDHVDAIASSPQDSLKNTLQSISWGSNRNPALNKKKSKALSTHNKGLFVDNYVEEIGLGKKSSLSTPSHTETHQAFQQPIQISPTKYVDTWSRFPSHSRPQRCEASAGESDQVSFRDFESDDDRLKKTERKPSFSGKKKKSRSQVFGRSVVKSVTRLYKSRSFDVEGRHMHRCPSIPNCSAIEYPEFEMLTGVFHSVPEALLESRRQSHNSLPLVDNQLEIKQGSGLGGHYAYHSARAWSKLYEDCVQNPYETEGTGMVNEGGNGAAVLSHLDSITT